MRNKVRAFIVFYTIVFLLFGIVTWLGNRVVSVMSETTVNANRHCIVIDAGHGGVDGGATSVTGILESTINLDIALRLNDLLNLLGYDTKMIRTTDISVYTEGETIAAKKVSDLKNRVKTVNETENAILISIHQNYFMDSQYNGAQVFYGNPDSVELAKEIQRLFIKTLNPHSKRAVKEATNIYLMNHINCDGVLIECGFLSNREEEYKLRNAAYQKQLCCVIASGISNYLDQP